MNLSEDLKKIFLVTVGAVAITAEKSKQVIDELIKQGELTVEQGKVLNEELKRNMKEKGRDVRSSPDDNSNSNNNRDRDSFNIVNQLEQMSEGEIQAIKDKIAKMERLKDNH
jgi:polyhydroxyalkanoate synthesis regulator phasin